MEKTGKKKIYIIRKVEFKLSKRILKSKLARVLNFIKIDKQVKSRDIVIYQHNSNGYHPNIKLDEYNNRYAIVDYIEYSDKVFPIALIFKDGKGFMANLKEIKKVDKKDVPYDILCDLLDRKGK